MTYDGRGLSFGTVAEQYDALRPSPPPEAAEVLGDVRGLDVLEVAAGTGLWTRFLLELGARVTIVEPDDDMRAVLLGQSPQVTAWRASAEALPFTDATFDAVLVGSAWHWFEQPAATNEMASFRPFLTSLLAAYGRSDMIEAVATDSGSTSEANARFVDERYLGYVMALKGNQPDLEREARRVMALRTQQAPDFETPWRSDSSRGVICQQIFRTVEMAGWGTWSHLRQVWLVRTLARPSFGAHGPARLVEERLYVTNLVIGRLSA